MAKSTDADLVRMTLSGQQEAYKELVGRYQGHVYGLAYSLLGDWTEAQDIAQETFIRTYSNLSQLREPAKFPAWLRRVAFGVSMDWLRAFRPRMFAQLEGRVDLEHLEIPDFRPGPPEVAAKRELAEAVLAAVASLPPKYRVPLTMFHLDGLSYQKVADFLDIPLGTAKSMIHRAKAKLKAALSPDIAREVAPAVQEVFNEHKLPAEFAARVLEGVADLSHEKHGCCLCGAVFACLEYLNDPVDYDFLMATSGAAFKLRWHLPDGCFSNDSMGMFGPEPVRRLFLAIGYEYQGDGDCGRKPPEEQWRQAIVASIDAGRPIISWGIVGAPDEGIVTGYEDDGRVLLGRSYFHDGSKGYYRKEDWYDDCCGLMLIGEKVPAPDRTTILRETLEWALQLGRVARSDDLPTTADGGANGLAGYEAWAEALRRDESFPADDLKALGSAAQIHKVVTLWGLINARGCAVGFLKSMADVSGDAEGPIRQAVAEYEAELAILNQAADLLPVRWDPDDRKRQMADPQVRRKVAKLLLSARTRDEMALDHLEKSLRLLQVSGAATQSETSGS